MEECNLKQNQHKKTSLVVDSHFLSSWFTFSDIANHTEWRKIQQDYGLNIILPDMIYSFLTAFQLYASICFAPLVEDTGLVSLFPFPP